MNGVHTTWIASSFWLFYSIPIQMPLWVLYGHYLCYLEEGNRTCRFGIKASALHVQIIKDRVPHKARTQKPVLWTPRMHLKFALKEQIGKLRWVATNFLQVGCQSSPNHCPVSTPTQPWTTKHIFPSNGIWGLDVASSSWLTDLGWNNCESVRYAWLNHSFLVRVAKATPLVDIPLQLHSYFWNMTFRTLSHSMVSCWLP